MKQRKQKEKKWLTWAQGSRDAMEDFGSLPSSSDFVPFTICFRSSSLLLCLSLFWFSAHGLFSVASSVSLRRNRKKLGSPLCSFFPVCSLSRPCFFFLSLYSLFCSIVCPVFPLFFLCTPLFWFFFPSLPVSLFLGFFLLWFFVPFSVQFLPVCPPVFLSPAVHGFLFSCLLPLFMLGSSFFPRFCLLPLPPVRIPSPAFIVGE